jgi:S1-C subfamily serine protease
MRRAFRGLPVLLGLALAVPAARAGDEGGEKVYQRVLKSTVLVLAGEEGKLTAQGTGSLIDRSRGLVVTNYHVVRDFETVVAAFPTYQKGKLVPQRDFYRDLISKGGGLRCKVLERDKRHDLALLQLERVPDGAQELKLARDSASPGQRVHSVGNPGQSEAMWLYTSGTVRQVYHKKWRARGGTTVYDFEAEVVETQSPINPGDSGGPLVNDRAELVGVTEGHASGAQLLSVFVDVSEVKGLLKRKGIVAKLGTPAPAGTSGETKATAAEPDPADRTEQAAATKLDFAQTLAKEGKTERARQRCEEILKLYPNTKAAKEAKALLEKLK